MCYISTKSTKFKMSDQNQYTEDNIRSLDWKEHIRMRPGMYIGKLGDGSSPDDGIYIFKRGARQLYR
jgi:DNA gyrase/topoisomerase IV subunit B